MDLPCKLALPDSCQSSLFPIDISALTGEGLGILQQKAMELIPRPTLVDGVGITRQRHRDCLHRFIARTEVALEMLASQQMDECLAAELQEALKALAEMLGEDIEEDVLDRIFADFCIGK